MTRHNELEKFRKLLNGAYVELCEYSKQKPVEFDEPIVVPIVTGGARSYEPISARDGGIVYKRACLLSTDGQEQKWVSFGSNSNSKYRLESEIRLLVVRNTELLLEDIIDPEILERVRKDLSVKQFRVSSLVELSRSGTLRYMGQKVNRRGLSAENLATYLAREIGLVEPRDDAVAELELLPD